MSLRSLMAHRVNIQHKTVTKDASGGKIDTWTNRVTGAPCRIEPALGYKTVNFDKLGMIVTHIIYFDGFYGITDLDRIEFTDYSGKTRHFEVRGSKDVDELRRLSEIWAQEVPT